MLYLYTDGSSTGRANREWGWGWVLVSDNRLIAYDFGGGPSGTNNVGELTAAIEGLAWILHDPRLKNRPITLISDSLYVLKTGNGVYKPQKNQQLCAVLRQLFILRKVEGKWVKGHSGNKFNEWADYLSKKGKRKYGAL
jgi:ribonuclease HI